MVHRRQQEGTGRRISESRELTGATARRCVHIIIHEDSAAPVAVAAPSAVLRDPVELQRHSSMALSLVRRFAMAFAATMLKYCLVEMC